LEELQRLAEQGHDESQFMLGYMYATGKDVAKNVQTAKVWLEEAAMANNPRAQYYLGELYNEAGKNDPRGAYTQMAYWWGKSAGHTYWETVEGYDGRAISMRRLAWLHMHSDFDAANPEDALRLLEKLTTMFGSPRSAIELGIVYSAGSFMPLSRRLGKTPIEQDAVKGIRLIERGVLIIENGSNDIDYNLYSAIGDTYLMRNSGTGTELIAAEALHKGIIYKTKAYERALGVNDDAAYDLQNQLSALENRPGAVRAAVESPAPPQAHEAINETPVLNEDLAAKFAKFTEYYDGLELDEKQDFIKNLDMKLQENPNPEYSAFLLQCIEKYNALTQGPSPDTGARQDISQDTMQDVKPESPNNKEIDTSYSSNENFTTLFGDGTDEEDGPHPLGRYTDRIHGFGISSPFLIGTLLYTLGGLLLPVILGLYVNHDWGFLGYAAVIFTLPPVIAMWLIIAASRVPKPSEKSLTGLMLFRLTFFFHLAIIAAVAAGLALRFGMDGQVLFGLSIFDTAFDLVLILVSLAVIVLYVTFYYGSLFSILKGIRDNIYSNNFDPLTGIGTFNGIHNIVSVLIIIGSIGVMILSLTPLDFVAIPNFVLDWFTHANMAISLIAVTLLISRIGGLISISVLRQFNSGLEYELEEAAEIAAVDLEEYS